MITDENKTILLVEDEAIIALACEETLSRQGYKVIVAHSGAQAVETVHSSDGIDLILMDIDLGAGMDGTQAAEIILRERDIPVLFLSSHTEEAIVARTEKITSYGYVVKNSGNTVLFASIKMAFRLYEAHQKLRQREDLLVASLREKEKASEALRESESQLRTLVNSMPDMVSLKDGEGRWLEANSYNLRLFGLEGVDYRGKTDYDLAAYSPEYRDAFIACADSDEKAWAAGSMYRAEETVPQRGGPDLVFDVIKVPTFPL
jgi:PAS domain S-box-containing protein